MTHPNSPILPGLDLHARTIFCIGRNFAEHARELGNEVPSEPVIFLKPLSSLVFQGGAIEIPPRSQRVDHEVEIVVALKAGGRDIPEARANECIAGYAVGIDVTARDLQEKAKSKGLPWCVAKGFDTFAALGTFVPAAQALGELALELRVNGELRQKGSSAQMLFSIPRLIAELSCVYRLAPGDVIYTGTPPGVAPLKAQDRVEATLLCGGSVLSRLDVPVALPDTGRR